jgi:diadenosine tetraphosphate (Ap4A) HIT family hydrolase
MGMPTVIAAEDGCVFCKKVLDGSAEQIGMSGVYHFEPLNPVTPGHRLFIPAFHYTDAVDATVAAGAVFEWVSWWIPRNNPDEDFNLLTSRGDAATQTIRHFHVHYVPRRPGDGLALPWTNQQTGGTR